MFNYLLKPFLGLLTAGGLVTGSYFLYKHSTTKKDKKSQEKESVSIGTKGGEALRQNLGSGNTGGRNNETASPGGVSAPGVVDTAKPTPTNGETTTGP